MVQSERNLITTNPKRQGHNNDTFRNFQGDPGKSTCSSTRGSNNEYTFSRLDTTLFMDYELELLRGVDERFIYELLRHSTEVDVQPTLIEAIQNPGIMARHSQVIAFAEEQKFGYTRKERR